MLESGHFVTLDTNEHRVVWLASAFVIDGVYEDEVTQYFPIDQKDEALDWAFTQRSKLLEDYEQSKADLAYE